jgi:integrase
MDTDQNIQASFIGPEDKLGIFEQQLMILGGLQASSTGRYRAHVAEFLAWRSGNAQNTPFASMVPIALRKEVEEYLGWCYRKGNGNTTRLGKLTAIQKYFRHLIYDQQITFDPTEEIPRPPRSSPAMIPFTRSEILRLFGAIDITTEKGIRDAVFMIMGAFAGFRVSEIWKLNIEDVIDDGDEMNLSIPKTKKKRYRMVWIWKAPAHYVRALLLARIGQGAKVGDPLLVSYKKNGKPRGNRRLTSCACDDLLKNLADRAGIRKAAIKTHMLRATHACDARHIRGYDVFAIMERLGWKNPETAARYITRREPTFRQYNNWHEYWIDFTKLWRDDINADSRTTDDTGVSHA